MINRGVRRRSMFNKRGKGKKMLLWIQRSKKRVTSFVSEIKGIIMGCDSQNKASLIYGICSHQEGNEMKSHEGKTMSTVWDRKKERKIGKANQFLWEA